MLCRLTRRAMAATSACLAFLAVAALAHAAPGDPADVFVIRATGVIDPFLADYLVRALHDADRAHAAASVIVLDTPGGLDQSMREIVEGILSSRTPVVVYVAPDGARAASAGVFISFAASVLAMSPTSSIGAAHPVDLHGASAPDKVTNDAASYLRGLAARRRRPVEWAESAVRASASLSASEAVARGVADLTASSVEQLCARIHGRRAETAAGVVLLRTRGARLRTIDMGAIDRLLHAIAHPNVAYVLFILGLYGLLFEFAVPGINFAGIAGAVCLVLSLVAFQALDASLGGLALLGLAGVLLIFDVTAPTHGVLTTGAILALVAGSLLLFRSGGAAMQLSPWLIALVVTTTILFAAGALRAGVRAQTRPLAMDPRAVVGQRGRAVSDLCPSGIVHAASEDWSAVTEDPPVAKGEVVDVLGLQGMTLRVRAVRQAKEEQT